jgi:hypothetical protein
VIAALMGFSTVISKVESEQVRYTSIFIVIGLPLILLSIIGVGRKILEKLEAVEKKLDEEVKPKSV